MRTNPAWRTEGCGRPAPQPLCLCKTCSTEARKTLQPKAKYALEELDADNGVQFAITLSEVGQLNRLCEPHHKRTLLTLCIGEYTGQMRIVKRSRALRKLHRLLNLIFNRGGYIPY